MNIAHIVRSLDPLEGGPPLVVVRLAAEAARRGHEVMVLSYETSEAKSRIDTMIGSLVGADQVHCIWLPTPGRLERILTLDTKSRFTKLLAGMDVVHLHGVWDSILKAAAGVAIQLKIPYVVAPHGMLDPWSLSQKSWKKKLALLAGYRAMLNQSAFLHLLNRDEKDLIRPLGLICDMRIIPNGVAPEEFADLPPAGTFRKSHPQVGSAPYVLFLSRLHYKKGLDILASAFAQLVQKSSAIHLVVAGRDEGAEAPFREQIHKAGLSDRVHLVGPIFGRDKLAALVDSECFCLPSRQEGFSVAILEAMACARPVVITTACHFPEVAEHQAGEVVPLEPSAIAAALQRVITGPAQMGPSGRALVLEHFTWPKVSESLISAYLRDQRHSFETKPEVSR